MLTIDQDLKTRIEAAARLCLEVERFYAEIDEDDGLPKGLQAQAFDRERAATRAVADLIDGPGDLTPAELLDITTSLAIAEQGKGYLFLKDGIERHLEGERYGRFA